MAAATKLVVSMVARTRKFEAGMRGAKKTLGSFVSGIKLSTLALASGAAALTVFGVQAAKALGRLASSSFKSINALKNVSELLGITTGELATLRQATKEVGISQQTADLAIQRYTRRVAEAAVGTGEAAGAFKELGLSAKELVGKGGSGVFELLNKLGQVRSEAVKLRLAFKIFDTEGAKFVNIVGGAAASLEDVARFAKESGLAVSELGAQKVKNAMRWVLRLKAAFEGVGNTIAQAVSPLIGDMAKQLTTLTIWLRKNLVTIMPELVTGITIWLDTFEGFFLMLKSKWKDFIGFMAVSLKASFAGINAFINFVPGLTSLTPGQVERHKISRLAELATAEAVAARVNVKNFERTGGAGTRLRERMLRAIEDATKAITGGGGTGGLALAGVGGSGKFGASRRPIGGVISTSNSIEGRQLNHLVNIDKNIAKLKMNSDAEKIERRIRQDAAQDIPLGF